MNLYQERLLSYYKNPQFIGIVEQENIMGATSNPSCGDSLRLSARIDNGVVTGMKYQGVGCVISRASAAMVCEYATGKTIDELKQIGVERIMSMLNVELGPNRMRCATLVISALEEGLKALC
jgi:nitrogen fixation NifU-like protein